MTALADHIIENGPFVLGQCLVPPLLNNPARFNELRAELIAGRRLSGDCDCGHQGLHAMFHLKPCPVAELRAAARRLGYDLALIPREDT